jgi:transcriptional regulator of arginine metabolism
MKKRKNRIDLIIELIRNECIGSQEELAQILSKKGHPVTQATLSRDLKMLRTTKVPTDRGTYMYVLPDSDSLKDKILSSGHAPINANYQSGLISIRFSGNIAVLKTRNGYASGLAYDIDMRHCPEILGTIPGSDTILAVIREDVSREQAVKIFAQILGFEPRDVVFD